jgi:hypothetical protein
MQRPFVEVNPVVGASSKRFVLFTQIGNFLEEFVNGTRQAGSVVHGKQGSTHSYKPRRARLGSVTPRRLGVAPLTG